MFNRNKDVNKLIVEVSKAQAEIQDLSNKVYQLENPPKYKVGDKVSWNYSSSLYGSSVGNGTIVKMARARFSCPHYDIWDGDRLHQIEEYFLLPSEP